MIRDENGDDDPMKIGLKLYSTDIGLIPEANRLRQKGLFDYIELYVIPQTPEACLPQWKMLDAPFVIHAAHSLHGLNLAQAEKEEDNKRYFAEAGRFADNLGADWIIVHGGNNGSISETIRQIGLLGDSRIIVENKPKIGLLDEACIGWCRADFHAFAEAGILNGMALDFVHASCAATAEGMDERLIIDGFLSFRPKVFHLSDGDTSSEKDIHLNLGKGNRNLGFYLRCIPPGGFVTIETPRNRSKGLQDFVEDMAFLSELRKKKQITSRVV